MKKSTDYFFIFCAILLFENSCNKSDRIIGIKIYEYDKDFHELVSRWNDMGINTAFVSKELAGNKDFRTVLKENDIPVYIIFPVFYNPVALQADSTLYAITNEGKIAKDEWVEFVCPSRQNYRSQQIEALKKLVTESDPDGISLDFIRHFVFWEKVFPEANHATIKNACFCQHCISQFCAKENVLLPDSLTSNPEKADYLIRHHFEKWNDFRTDLIASMVEELAAKAKEIKPSIKINVHTVPWRTGDFNGANINVAGQDLSKIEQHADYISPMCYSQMLKRDAPWISSVVNDMNESAKNKILPSIQVSEYYLNNDFNEEEFKQCITEALEPPSLGVVFWSWPLFEKDSAKIEVVKRMTSF